MSEKRFNPEKAQKLLSEERRERMNPERLMDQLGLEEGEVTADLGAGNGFFTIPFAKRTSTTVYAVDIEPKMLEMLKERADQEELDNIHYVVSDLEKIDVADQSVTKVMVSFVIHEVGDVKQVLDEIKRITRPGGEVMFIEWEAVETESGPPLDHRISSGALMEILSENGFSPEFISISPENYAVKGTL
ncbi:class I SAM-dependent methyltransferase [Halobacillus litoralis]|uniref:class I SAM-dependent methyltransferase n=1 Tax=Halobacillus litoralis TaxID=45668 RepID=UPI001CFE61A9|nr:class I SAM-dependent methyltransferase [Halobacillus litoralis]